MQFSERSKAEPDTISRLIRFSHGARFHLTDLTILYMSDQAHLVKPGSFSVTLEVRGSNDNYSCRCHSTRGQSSLQPLCM